MSGGRSWWGSSLSLRGVVIRGRSSSSVEGGDGDGIGYSPFWAASDSPAPSTLV